MRTIRLYGPMGERFGREHRYDVHSPAEAIRALTSTVPGFRAYLIAHREDCYRVWAGAATRSERTLIEPCAEREVIRIAPVAAGAAGNVVKGVAMIVVGTLLSMFGGQYIAAMGVTEMTGAAIASAIGYAMIMGGISTILTPKPPSVEANVPAEQKASFMFDGPVNVMRQGGPVPLAYGRVLVGSTVVSASLVTQQITA